MAWFHLLSAEKRSVQDGTLFDADAVLWNARRGMERVSTSYYAKLVWGNVKRWKNLAAMLCVLL